MNALNMNEDNLLNLNSINKPVYYLISQDFYGCEVYDILNKNVGVARNVSQNQIVDQSYNVINQYFLIGFTYSLQKSGLTGQNSGGGPRMMIRM